MTDRAHIPTPASSPASAPRPASASGPVQFPWLLAAAFVVVWSSGYIAGPAGVQSFGPFLLLTVRFVLATAILAPLALWRRGRPRMDRLTVQRVCLVGLAMNALQFGLMYLAFDLGLGATLGALLHSLSPVLTVVLSGMLLRERIRRVQVVGLAVGVAGVALVLGPDVTRAGGIVAVILGLLSMLALSLGTLGQRWIPPGTDPWWSATLQFTVSIPPLAVLALLTERDTPVHHLANGITALLYLAVVNSVIGLLLLGALVRRGGAGTSSSVFFLMPPVTAVLAYLLLHETLDLREFVGIVVAVVGVALGTVRRRSRAAPSRVTASPADPTP